MARAVPRTTSPVRANVPVKKVKKTEGHVDDHRRKENHKLEFIDEEKVLQNEGVSPLASGSNGSRLRASCRSVSRAPKKHRPTIMRANHKKLGNLLDRLAATHRWREASGVLSTLLAGSPRSYSLSEDRRNFLIAMELQKRFCRKGNYHHLIKSTYEIWLGKLSWHPRGQNKKRILQLELALFYISQGKFEEAYSHTRYLVTNESGSEPYVNLIHGLILYQLWYSDLPKEMQIKGFDVQTSLDALGMPMTDGYQETEICDSSNEHDAVDIDNNRAASQCFSESSVGNEKFFVERKKDLHGDRFNAHDTTDYHLEDYEEREPPASRDNFTNTSIFFASGLDKRLLPIQLRLLTDDPVQSINLYRKLVNEKYRDGVKHLRLALHSTPPSLAALLPLIQLLLLGDNVHEAISELDKSCNKLDSALPFRLKARLLQCFCSNQISAISAGYESALARDPSCNYSMERLIKMHKTGNYSTSLLLEMLAKHLDAVDGKCSIWEEFASCFLKVQSALLFHYEDCVSTNIGSAINNNYSCKIPTMFTEGEVGDTWRIRCRWWASRHFGKRICLSEIQSGAWMLLQFKGACAVHLYGPNFEYVTSVLNHGFTQQGNASQLSYLHAHIQNPMNLADMLAEL